MTMAGPVLTKLESGGRLSVWGNGHMCLELPQAFMPDGDVMLASRYVQDSGIPMIIRHAKIGMG
jgi:hypothetical protein